MRVVRDTHSLEDALAAARSEARAAFGNDTVLRWGRGRFSQKLFSDWKIKAHIAVAQLTLPHALQGN